jgi:flagellar basal-body rod modification protein FlgD
MSSPVSSIATNAATAPSTATASTKASDSLANESTFLKLLVAQMQNQDPLNPADSTQFVSQLTSYSQLEQLIRIDNNTASLASANSTDPSTTSTSKTGN